MSEATVVEPPVEPAEAFASGSVPLLKEYLEKLSDVQKKARELHSQFHDQKGGLTATDLTIYREEFGYLEHYVNKLLPAVMRFTQQVSGMVDQGRVTPLTRSELGMRLAELEAAMVQLPRLLGAYRPRK